MQPKIIGHGILEVAWVLLEFWLENCISQNIHIVPDIKLVIGLIYDIINAIFLISVLSIATFLAKIWQLLEFVPNNHSIISSSIVSLELCVEAVINYSLGTLVPPDRCVVFIFFGSLSWNRQAMQGVKGCKAEVLAWHASP